MTDTILRLSEVSVDIPLRGIRSEGGESSDCRIWHDSKGNLMLRALHEISFEVRRGEKIGIVGINGSGKTTLLKAIAGLMPISNGTIEIFGSVRPLLSIGAGTYPALSGRKNTLLRYGLLGIKSVSVEHYVTNVQEFAELGDFFDLPVTTYSPGMLSRLQFAMNTVEAADILLMDEWFGVADQRFQKKARMRLEEYVGQNEAFLFASHNGRLIERSTDRTITIDNGALLDKGP